MSFCLNMEYDRKSHTHVPDTGSNKFRLSKYHKDHPYSMDVNGQEFKVSYVPGDSDSGLFGGNSNWRGVCHA